MIIRYTATLSFLLIFFNCNAAEIESCLRSNNLQVVTRNDDSYGNRSAQFWTTGTIIEPEGIIVVRNKIEVRIAIKCAVRSNTHLAIKSGGHSCESYSLGSNSSWVIDLSNFNKIKVNYLTKTVTIGGGVITNHVYDRLKKKGYFIPFAISKTIGFSGLSMGGGIGFVGSQYGLTLDRLLNIKIITADGIFRTVSKNKYCDLFWALRGAGGGNFGVVTQLKLRIEKAPKCVIRVQKNYSNEFAATIFHTWQNYFTSNDVDNSVSGTISLNLSPGVQIQIFIATESKQECYSLLDEVEVVFPNITIDDVKKYKNYFEAQDEFSDGADPAPRPFCMIITNFFVSNQLSFNESNRVAEIMKNNQNGAWFYGQTFGGKINEVNSEATAFVHRTSRYNVLLNSGAKCDESFNRSVHLTSDNFSFMENGESYQNYISKQDRNYLRRYYGDNLKRLIRIKNKYDPQNFFNFAQSIPLKL